MSLTRSAVNVGQLVPDGYYLTYAATTLLINEWWGRIDDARALMATVKMPIVKMDFADWMEAAK